MNRFKLFTWLVFILLFFIKTTTAQQLNENFTKEKLENLIDSLSLPFDATLNYSINSEKLFDNAFTDAEKEARKNLLIERQSTDPDNGRWFALYIDFCKDSVEEEKYSNLAIEKYQKQFQSNEKSFIKGSLILDLGDVYYSKKDYQKAFQLYEQAYTLMPDSTRSAFKLGMMYLLSNRIDQAKQLFVSAMNNDINNYEAQLMYVYSFIYKAIQQGNFKEENALVIDYSYLQKMSNLDKNNIYAATLFQSARLFEIFYPMLFRIIDKYDSVDDKKAKISYFFQPTEKEKVILNEAEIFFQSQLKNPTFRTKLFIYESLGIIKILQGNRKESEMNYKQVLNLDPKRTVCEYAVNCLIMLSALEKDFANATKIAAQEYQLHNNVKNAITHVALQWRISKTNKEVKTLADTYLAKYPNDWQLNLYKGILLLKDKQSAEAVEQLTKTVRLNKEEKDSHLWHGLALLSEGKTENAYDALLNASLMGLDTAKKIIETYFKK
ncbi:MAG: hypothetical protein EAZ55_14225 [Cytophagales bacterium]|nr:MAG: hypothetical protein EAZ55_14225 [Cytophagales bacterium]